MRTWTARSASVLVACLCACTPAPPPAHTPAAHRPPPSVAVVAPQPDLSPVGEPAGLIGLARARNVGATLDAAARMIRLPLSPSALAREELAKAGRDMIKLDGSFDAAFVLDPASTDDEPKILAAFALPVTSIDEALVRLERNGEEFVPIAPGVYRGVVRTGDDGPGQRPPGDEDASEASSPLHCDLAMSLGDAPAKLVCGDSPAELDAIRPWLTRGLPTAARADADLHAELRFAPLQARYGGVLRSQADAWSAEASRWLETEANVREPTLLQAPGAVLQDGVRFVDDLEVLSMDLSLEPNAAELSARGRLKFKGRSSWWTQVITASHDEAGPPPPIFWRAPKDSDTATYGRGVDPKHYEGIRRVVLTAASTLLPQTRVPERTRVAIEQLIATAPLHDADVVSSQGFIPPVGRRKPSSERKPADAIADAKDMINQYFGWTLAGIEAPSADYTAWLRKAGALCARLLQDARADKELGPIVRKEAWVPSVRVVERPAGLPRGSVAVDFVVRFDSKMAWELTRIRDVSNLSPHPPGAVATGTVTFRIAVIPDGARRTWIASSTDLASLATHAKAALSSAPDAGTIAALPELAALRSDATTSASMFVFGRVVQKTLATMRSSDSRGRLDEVDRVIASLPNKLMTPVLIIGRGTPGPAPVSEIEVRFLRGTIDDLGALVTFAMTDKGRALLESLDEPEP